MEYRDIIKIERNKYFPTKKKYIKSMLLNNDDYNIWKFQYRLRKTELYKKKKNKSILYSLLYVISKRRKEKLARKIGFNIPEGCFEEGLRIYHIGAIAVNPAARIGKNCIIVGNVCIGNVEGLNVAPKIGDNCMLGWGTTIIGDIHISNNCKIAAGAVVVKDVNVENDVVGGVPAKSLK